MNANANSTISTSVRGRTSTWTIVSSTKSISDTIKAGTKLLSLSSWYSFSLFPSLKQSVHTLTWTLFSWSTLRASIACDKYLLTRFDVPWSGLNSVECLFMNGLCLTLELEDSSVGENCWRWNRSVPRSSMSWSPLSKADAVEAFMVMLENGTSTVYLILWSRETTTLDTFLKDNFLRFPWRWERTCNVFKRNDCVDTYQVYKNIDFEEEWKEQKNVKNVRKTYFQWLMIHKIYVTYPFIERVSNYFLSSHLFLILLILSPWTGNIFLPSPNDNLQWLPFPPSSHLSIQFPLTFWYFPSFFRTLEQKRNSFSKPLNLWSSIKILTLNFLHSWPLHPSRDHV